MPYTPALNEELICTLRRMAWHAEKPMTKVLEEAVIARAKKFSQAEICSACLDSSKCELCLYGAKKR